MEGLISRLEAVTVRLEDVAARKGASGGATVTVTGSDTAVVDMTTVTPAVAAFDALLAGHFAQFVALSQKIGGDVSIQVEFVKVAFKAERDFLLKASHCKQPSQPDLVRLLQPISDKITAAQKYREDHRQSAFFSHLSAVSESVPALGWVAVTPAPAPYIKEMSDAGQFYTNRVLKDFKEKDVIHVDWVKSWLSTLTDLQAYVKQYHTTGVQWNKQGGDAAAHGAGTHARSGPPGCPPPPPGPPPPPVFDMPSGGGSAPGGGVDAKSALFSELSKGEDVTKGLRKVTDDMKTHKNPGLRATDAPVPGKPAPNPKGGASPAKSQAAAVKPSRCVLDGKKWVVEHYTGNKGIVISETEMKQTVYIYKCVDCTIQIKGKVNAITLDGCKKTALVFDEVVASVDFVNCQSVQVQVISKVPTISIDKTDGCMVYLSKDSLKAQIVTAKSSEMNILVPDESAGGEFKEFAIPEQFRTHWDGKKLVTDMTDSLG